jgi:uncharacterized membrane protein
MTKGRLEGFSDAMIAVIITIMVLEMKVPHGADFEALGPLLPVLLAYALSYVYIGIYWSNHHQLTHAVERVSGSVLWANLHLLFWLSLIPFVTGWMSENHFAALPVAMYGFVLLCAGIAYFMLARLLSAVHGSESTFTRSLGADFKTKLSVAIYAVAIPLAFVHGWIACALYALVAAMWLVPDRRFEPRQTR